VVEVGLTVVVVEVLTAVEEVEEVGALVVEVAGADVAVVEALVVVEGEELLIVAAMTSAALAPIAMIVATGWQGMDPGNTDASTTCTLLVALTLKLVGSTPPADSAPETNGTVPV
jgi:hypothetical protein